MDRIEDVLERQLAHLRKMISLLETGGAVVKSEGSDISGSLAIEHRELEAELSNALDRHRVRTISGSQPSR